MRWIQIALSVGLTIASQLNARFLDRIYIHHENKKGGVGEPELDCVSYYLFSRCGIDSQLLSDNGPRKYYVFPVGLMLSGWGRWAAQRHLLSDIR